VTIFGIPATPRQLCYALGDLLVVLLAGGVAHVASAGAGGALGAARSALFLAAATWLVLYVADAYDVSLDFRRRRELARLWAAVALATGLALVGDALVPRGGWGLERAGLAALCLALLLPAWRALACQLRPDAPLRRRTLVVGDGPPARALAEAFGATQDRVYELVGAVHDDAPGPSAARRLGGLQDLDAAVRAHAIDQIVVACATPDDDGPLLRQLLACKARGVHVDDMPTLYKRLTGKVPIRQASAAWLVFGPAFRGVRGVGAATQRALDVAIALVGAVLSAPVVAVAALAVRLESRGPAFYLQERVGRDERPFRIVKLRTMREDAEDATGAVWSQGEGDPRVTRVGRLLRRTRIDELPQFYNVLRGDMSVVGPRPEREPFVTQLKARVPFYGLRFAVKPGVTGWAQVRYRYGASEEDAAEKLCYELYAIQEMSPALYAVILLKTMQTVLLRPGS
jgi:exopolysaccharide biosynthesis polyprenyl glycosylphosphotransferase